MNSYHKPPGTASFSVLHINTKRLWVSVQFVTVFVGLVCLVLDCYPINYNVGYFRCPSRRFVLAVKLICIDCLVLCCYSICFSIISFFVNFMFYVGTHYIIIWFLLAVKVCVLLSNM